MAYDELDIDVDDNDEIELAALGLKLINSEIPKKVRQAIQQHARAAAEEAKQKAKAMPVEGDSGHTGLRKEVAAGVRVQRRTDGATITTQMPEEDEAVIPLGLDTRKGWRHPVFGNREKWVRQHGKYSWFMEPMHDIRQPLTEDIEDILDDAADEFGWG